MNGEVIEGVKIIKKKVNLYFRNLDSILYEKHKKMKFFNINVILIVFCVSMWCISSFDYKDQDTIMDSDDDEQQSNSLITQQFTLNDWDSSLYDKSICINIPSNMSLCNNINYKQMKVPNLLGHEGIDEVSANF